MKRWILFVVILIGLLPLPSVAGAHSGAEIREWERGWIKTTWEDGHITREEATEWTAFKQENSYLVLPVLYRQVEPSASVERWRGLVEKYFKPRDVQWAMRVMECESRGDPNAKNPHSSASGLFQHLGSYWPERSTKAGWAGADIFDPEANIAVAAWLLDWGGRSHWVCK